MSAPSDLPDSDDEANRQQHDAYFKAVFSEPENAAAFFRGHLPTAVSAPVDWATLTVVPGSFVKKSLRQTHSDLLFSARAGHGEVLLYLLFEHQTTVDELMPLRLLTCMVEIFQTHAKQRGLPLPVVLPFVLHQGPRPWSAVTRFEDLMALPPEVAPAFLPYVPKFAHALLDLSRFDPAREEDQAPMRMVLQLMKLAREQRLLEFLSWLAVEFANQIPDPLLRTSLLYALQVDSHLDVETIAHTLEANTTLKEQAMSVADQLIAKGRADGEAHGEARGKVIGQLTLLQKMMGLPGTPEGELAALSLEQLQARLADLEGQYHSEFKRRP